MQSINMNQVMDEFHDIVNTAPVEEAVTRVVRQAGFTSNGVAVEALARLLVIQAARLRHAEAKLAVR